MPPSFTVLIPARLASTRLPNKPLADIAGLPMVVRVARQAARSAATRVVVATDAAPIAEVCEAHGVHALLTRADHPTGSDRLAEACDLLRLDNEEVVVNVQGDEPLIEPELIDACAHTLWKHPACVVSTAAHAITEDSDYHNPHVVKVVLNREGHALYFSRAPIPHWRDAPDPQALPSPAPLRHMGIYGYRVHFLRRFPTLEISPLERVESLEQLRVLWHGERIAVYCCAAAPAPGVDTPEDLERVRALFATPP